MITIIDYGVGNIGSISNMLKKIGEPSVITSNPEELKTAEKIILCGVGAFDDGMKNLEEKGLIPVLKDKVLNGKIPILGICLGMQLFTEHSEEGQLPGLGFVKGGAHKFNFKDVAASRPLRIPHMGWNQVKATKNSPLLENMYEDPRFYFVHSFYVKTEQEDETLLQAEYGRPFTAAFEKDNILGVQFHPEKSHKFGMRLFENFVRNY